jgi:hypothetical protein
MVVEKRYRALRFIGSLYKVIGIILGVITILAALSSCIFSALSGSIIDNAIRQGFGNSSGGLGFFSGFLGGVIVGFILLLNGGIASTMLYAIGEAIYLFINVEENTRATVTLLQQETHH